LRSNVISAAGVILIKNLSRAGVRLVLINRIKFNLFES